MKLLEIAKNLKNVFLHIFLIQKKFNIMNEHVTNYEASKRCVYATLYHNWIWKGCEIFHKSLNPLNSLLV